MEPARDLLAAAVDLQPGTGAWRRRLPRRPEVGLTLPETQATVLDAIAGLPLKVTTGTAVTSVVGVLEGGRPRARGAPAEGDPRGGGHLGRRRARGRPPRAGRAAARRHGRAAHAGGHRPGVR